MRSIASFLVLLAWCASPLPAQEGPGDAVEYRVQAKVWSRGELRGEPELVLTPGTPGRFEIRGPDSAWRIGVDVEPPTPDENAESDALWLRVTIEQRIDGRWEFLTDTMLGTRAGRPGRISVVEDAEGGTESARDDAALYMELSAEAAGPR